MYLDTIEKIDYYLGTLYKCEICGESLKKEDLDKAIKFTYRNPESDIIDYSSYKKYKVNIYIHPNCLDQMFDNEFSEKWNFIFNNSVNLKNTDDTKSI